MKAAAKRGLLYGALGLAFVAGNFMDRQASSGGAVAPDERNVPSKGASHRPTVVLDSPRDNTPHLENFDRSLVEEIDSNPFGVKSWAPAAPPQAVAAPVQEKPSAPPMPFSYAGKMKEDDGRWVAYLVKGEISYNVHLGETFADVYRLNSIGPAQLEIEYLPSAAKQTLPTAIEQ